MVQGKGKYTVITGASSGIGYEAAKVFAKRGKNLVITARRKDRLEMLKREILGKQPDLDKISMMLHLDIEALTILSSLYVRDYRDVEGTQLINISSCGGYTIVPTAVTYCAAKFYVSTFTEGLAWGLEETGAKMRAKVLAPAATKTEFGMVANNVSEYDYDKSFGTYHTGRQMAAFLLELYDSAKVVGIVDRESFRFRLADPLFPYAGKSDCNRPSAIPSFSSHDQKMSSRNIGKYFTGFVPIIYMKIRAEAY